MVDSTFIIGNTAVELEQVSRKGAANGYAPLDASSLIDPSYLPASGGVDSLAKSGSAQLTGDVTLSEGSNVTLTQSGNDIAIAAAGGGGLSSLILFDSTLVGATAAIDTGANGIAQTAQTLVVDCILRTSQAIAISTVLLTLNNDTGANYDNVFMQNVNATVAGGNARGANNIAVACLGANASASAPSHIRFVIHGYRDTTFHKAVTVTAGGADAAAADCFTQFRSGRWRNTAAITRLAVTAGSGNLAIGSRVTIYGLL